MPETIKVGHTLGVKQKCMREDTTGHLTSARSTCIGGQAVATPAEVSKKLAALLDSSVVTKVPYAEAVGSLMYAMPWTKPGIAYIVEKVASSMAMPRQVLLDGC